jgi:alpha-beta hydrolase superfamily lysophospholipase
METHTLVTADGHQMHYYRWLPSEAPMATVQIAHGMGEHAARYDWTAEHLTGAGFAVYAQDHRGHGRSATRETFGEMGANGWNRTIADASELRKSIARNHPDLKHALIGHSMGAMLTQQYLYRFGSNLDAAVISGSPGFGNPFQLWLSHTIARFETWRLGPEAHSDFLQNMIFGKSNEPFDSDGATGFEWLSRDPDQVAKYVADEACGFVLRAGSLANLMAGAREARKKASVAGIPTDLPVYVFSGSADPVHGEEKGLERLLKKYRARLSRVDYRLYPDGRHEMLNETNRDEVIDDLIAWLRQALR